MELPRPHSAQRRIIDNAGRFNVLCCGRRFGKDVLGMDRVAYVLLAGQPAAWFNPTYKMLTEVWRSLCEILQPVTRRRSEQEHRLELLTGGVLDMWSLDSADTARGRAYALAVINEAAMVPGLADAWQQVIRPTLSDYKGGAWFLSTPRGLNAFHTLYQLGSDPTNEDWRAWRFPTGANPFIPASEIAAARRELPERVFAQEYLAEFLADEGAVFRRLREAATATAQSEAVEDHQYVIGCDWGKLDDFSVFSVLDVTTKEQVAQERFNQIDYIYQVGRLKALAQRFKPSLIVAERNSIGVPILEQLQRTGLPVWGWTASNATKHQVIEALGLALEQSKLRILDDAILLGELQAYQAERLPSGLLRYSAPEGMHDDCVMALALAWQGTQSGANYEVPSAKQTYTLNGHAVAVAEEWDPFGGRR